MHTEADRHIHRQTAEATSRIEKEQETGCVTLDQNSKARGSWNSLGPLDT